MSAPKRPCLDGEGLELAFQQAQENMERLRRQMEENAARQVVPPSTATPPVANPQPAVESQPASTQLQSASNQPVAQPHPAIVPPGHLTPAAQSQSSTHTPTEHQNTPYRAQPSFATAATRFDGGFRGGRSRQRRTDTRGRMFYVYVCRNHSSIYCQICGEYLAAPDFFDRNPGYEY